MSVLPAELEDVMRWTPGIMENSPSSGVATVSAMASGFAPGSAADTWIVGYSTSGRLLTGSEK